MKAVLKPPGVPTSLGSTDLWSGMVPVLPCALAGPWGTVGLEPALGFMGMTSGCCGWGKRHLAGVGPGRLVL